MTTTRLSTRYRVHLVQLRTRAYLIEDATERNTLLDLIQALAGDLAMGFPTTEECIVDDGPLLGVPR